MLPVAHRGFWWPDPARRNTPDALLAAAQQGWAFETDVLWLPERLTDPLVVAHTVADPLFPIRTILPACEAAPAIFWNLKEPRAEVALRDWLDAHGLRDKSYVFDVELYDAAGLDRVVDTFGREHVLVRCSERKPETLERALAARVHGIWFDTWETDWVTVAHIEAARQCGLRSYVISAELHARPLRLESWKSLRVADGICTDFPHLLRTVLTGDLDCPATAWWMR